ncbi:TPA: DUF2971 domain-containing protein [Enterobacter cloacae]|nr:DUF2971 domain-containing protein [Enterobacter cloacae]
MYYFKYFRNDANFEKTIRYNELYFAANNSLNDPMDLWVNPLFWDDVKLWEQLITNYEIGSICLMDYMKKTPDADFYASINNLFRNKSLAQVTEQYTVYQTHIMQIISKKELATGADIKSAASFLMDKFVHVKNTTNFISVSFSKDPFNYLMWSHYANGFKGCLLVYDFENNKAKLKKHILGGTEYQVTMSDVNYSNTPLQIDLWKILSKNIINNGSYFFTKNKHWEYEKESRLVLHSTHASNGEIFHHHPLLVKGVIFGSRCDKSFKDKTIQALKENRKISGIDVLLSFDTILNEKNEIELKSGYKHNIKKSSYQPMKEDVVNNWGDAFRFK